MHQWSETMGNYFFLVGTEMKWESEQLWRFMMCETSALCIKWWKRPNENTSVGPDKQDSPIYTFGYLYM